jgi:hypothetical protein
MVGIVLPIMIGAWMFFYREQGAHYNLAFVNAISVVAAWTILLFLRHKDRGHLFIKAFGVGFVALLPALALAWCLAAGSTYFADRLALVSFFLMVGINWSTLHDFDKS